MNGKDVKKIVVACDAGMGSSVMLASQLRKELKKFDVVVEHTPVNTIPGDADIVVCHQGLAARAAAGAGGKPIVKFQVFIGDPAVKSLVNAIKNGGEISA
jgi:mannitol-specific phosphotransferase system IIBC component